ncbi:MAG: 3-isopropylmalate dehydratase small subunit [Alphaproteobacteria bacterium]|nr:3-isopropylmalate dehydratase small subunit [Alphaproteobacteria bacterium]
MESLVRIKGVAAPLLRINVDTDQIIPGPEIMASVDESYARWGTGLFAYWRYLDGAGGAHTPNPEFVLNRPPYDRAVILLADRNFGCGSSREPAPKALRGFGIRAVIAPSFGGIFFNNCFRNGVLPIELSIEAVRELAGQVERSQGRGEISVDLEAQRITAPEGDGYGFRTPPLLRRMLLEGLDEIGATLARRGEIEGFRGRDRSRRPWAYRPGLA